ncbi:hypothetical protein CONLIGDRAFT_693943 [Coniochaeta ligniaria NRRL 30616]|uniref:Uncharacterized protein n=1 Tax=Coniochaeta ligniaria NRRL 30616 TaxID=1408157 RepID=A0A1J7I7I4_9PEZI|nr:hypothetical protein CONLIGDRAFT_693943 [Coniochaeta ligniaria NRRL 30616]
MDEIIARHAEFFAAQQWALVPIKHPRIIFNDDLDIEGYLNTITKASDALVRDIATFTADERFMRAETMLGRCFVSACVYHTEVLLGSSLRQLQARDDIVHTTQQSEAFMNAKGNFAKLQVCTEGLRIQIENRHWQMNFPDMGRDRVVPSAGPFQILVQMVVQELDVSAVNSEAKARTFLQSFKKAALLRDQQHMSGCVATEPGDGRPTMMFFSIYPNADASKPPILLFGCNEIDHGLRNYIPVAFETFTFLHGREQSLGQGLTVPITKEDLIEIRQQAVNDTHRDQSFLGGTNEVGLALRTKGWSPNKPCYLCYGMMGYQQAILWKPKDQKNYNATFD